MKLARIIWRSLGWDGIEAAATVRAATGEAAEAQPRASAGTVLGDGFGGVLRTGGNETARRQPTETGRLVQADNEKQRSGERLHRSPDLLARCIASVTRLLSS
jgi:hypothetical protein